ncbi:Putative nosiheptide resistance regulatory protein [Streptomyces clavuligerus]|uniref:Putative nosiheptide resistance regulatory protein n=2 Tax=Streptomyces clavuligerus TaxID=1901 RepID=E2PWK8_STRCL|nr:Putative nosiheptide resistance regulatory protein [Streptomyces clavuligerus]
MESVRAATDSAKDSVLHAAEVVAPYASTARDQAAQYAHEARERIAPKVSAATHRARVQARHQYDAHLAPHVPPAVDDAAHRAALQARKAARQAADYTKPRVEHAVAAAGPVRDEALARSSAALAALRGQVTAEEIQKLLRRHERRSKAAHAGKVLLIVGAAAGCAFALWRWWDRQANPDWLVEPPAATETGRLSSVDGSPEAVDPVDPGGPAQA